MGSFNLKENTTSCFEVSLQELLALQKLVSKQKYPRMRSVEGAMLQKSKIRGRGMDYVETRNYFPGDDVRLMDWRVTARTHKPHVKVFEVEKERPVLILLNMSPTMFFGTRVCLKSVLATKLAGLLAWTAKTHGDRVGGMLTSMAMRSLWLPHAHNQTLINFLKSASNATSQYQDKAWNDWSNEKSSTQFLRALQELNKTLKPGTLILMISDWYDDPTIIQPYLFELRLHHDMILYHVTDILEQGISEYGVYPISNGQAVKTLNLQTSTSFQNYAHFCEDNMAKWQQIANKIRVPYYACSVETDLSLLVRQSLLRSLRG
jgi:hypothetical protein